MSFILDALKKAERQRPPGPVPDLFVIHGPQAQLARRPARAIIAVALVLVVAALLVWAWPGADRRDGEAGRTQVDSAPPPAATAPVRPASPPRAVVLPVREPDPYPEPATAVGGTAGARRPAGQRAQAARRSAEKTRVMQEQATAIESSSHLEVPASPTAPIALPPIMPSLPASRAVAPSPTVPAPPIPPSTGAVPGAASPAVQGPAPPIVAPVTAPAPAAAPAPEEAPPADGRILELDALPASVRAGLPKMIVSGHVWSDDPTLRLMTMDDRLLREGGEAAPGVRLQEITPEGGVFVFKGWHFRVGRMR